jgi:hypothetical protein
MNRRDVIFGSVAATAAATVALPVQAAEHFEPFEISFYVEDDVRYPDHGWIIHRASRITIPFDEYGEGALDVSDFDENTRRQIRIGIDTRVPEKYLVLFNENDGILFCKLYKRLTIPQSRSAMPI